ncbi:MAG: TlpA family protein disulfide reductase [Xanthomonadales bacterium]|nr:TlpA family protein disulfide reductase [Xanthomonadales bacterium]
MRKTEFILMLLVAVIMAAGGFALANYFNRDVPIAPTTTKIVADLTGKPTPDYRLGSLTGSVFKPEDFNGQVVLYNFWATWCSPCVKEMPMLQRVHDDYSAQGFTVVGIALDEVLAVREFTTKLSIHYPILIGADDVMRVNRDFGNTSGALPYSVLVDRKGIVRWWDWGIVEEDELITRIEELL